MMSLCTGQISDILSSHFYAWLIIEKYKLRARLPGQNRWRTRLRSHLLAASTELTTRQKVITTSRPRLVWKSTTVARPVHTHTQSKCNTWFSTSCNAPIEQIQEHSGPWSEMALSDSLMYKWRMLRGSSCPTTETTSSIHRCLLTITVPTRHFVRYIYPVCINCLLFAEGKLSKLRTRRDETHTDSGAFFPPPFPPREALGPNCAFSLLLSRCVFYALSLATRGRPGIFLPECVIIIKNGIYSLKSSHLWASLIYNDFREGTGGKLCKIIHQTLVLTQHKQH